MANSEPSFYKMWNREAEFGLSSTEPQLCVFAREFSDWTRELCAAVTQSPNLVIINQSKVLLIDKYFDWRSVVPKTHRNRMSSENHICIFQVFEQAYVMLRAVELSLTPPMLFIPPPPAPPPPQPPAPQIAGIYIGEGDNP